MNRNKSTMNINLKKGKLWWRYRLHCHYCGKDIWVNYTLLRLKLILCNERFNYVCSHCHSMNTMQLFFHLVHDSVSKDEKEFNRNHKWEKRLLK